MDLLQVVFLILSCCAVVFGGPVPASNVEKRRESTPEILGLEQQLKKAAGENEQLFSHNVPRPMPQIDGLDQSTEQLLQDSADNDDEDNNKVELEIPALNGGNDVIEPVDNDVIGDETGTGSDVVSDVADESDVRNDIVNGNDVAGGVADENDITGNIGGPQDPQDMESYMAMWKMFKQNPQFMEDLYQEYLGKSPDGSRIPTDIDPDNLPPVPADVDHPSVKRGDGGAFVYPGDSAFDSSAVIKQLNDLPSNRDRRGNGHNSNNLKRAQTFGDSGFGDEPAVNNNEAPFSM